MNGPATKVELADVCCRTINAIYKSLKSMQNERVIHIKGFVGKANVSPLYALGNQADAKPPRRTNCGRVLTENAVINVRRLLNDGKKQKEVAALFGISVPTVSNIKNGKAWKHIKEMI